VPYGLERYQQTGQAHFVTFSCFKREPYLRDSRLATAFLRSLELVRRRYQMRIYAYVVMPEHVHLLLSEPDTSGLCRAIQALKISVARKAEAYQITPLWQKRYYDHNIRGYRSFVEKLRYLHRNPVKRGLCESPIEWEWSSFRHYATAEAGLVEVESEWTEQRRSGTEPRLLTGLPE
jgi:REP-associated tyrosine transposase